MRKSPPTRQVLFGMAPIVLAVGAAFVPAAAFAGTASLSIDGFVVTTDNVDPTVFLYAPMDGQYQTYQTSALDAGGLNGASPPNFLEAFDWNGYVRSSLTANALAKADTNLFTDNFTQFTSVGFNLTASTTASSLPGPLLPNQANATVSQAGWIGLINSNGDFVAGNVSFDIYYSYNVNSPGGNALNDYSQVALNLYAGDANQSFEPYSFGAISTSQPGGMSGDQQGMIHLDFALVDGDVASYSVTGNAVAFSPAAVPEPGSLAMTLAGLGTFGWLFTRRRRAASGADRSAA